MLTEVVVRNMDLGVSAEKHKMAADLRNRSLSLAGRNVELVRGVFQAAVVGVPTKC